MTQSQDNKIFTAADIERYHNGTMTVEERHAIEKAALDDPFLADALEGYAFTSTPTDDIVKLQKRLEEKMGKRKLVPLFSTNRTWLRAAAIILVVAGSIWILFRAFSPEQKTIALEQVHNDTGEKNKTASAPVTKQALADSNALDFQVSDSSAYAFTKPQKEILKASDEKLRQSNNQTITKAAGANQSLTVYQAENKLNAWQNNAEPSRAYRPDSTNSYSTFNALNSRNRIDGSNKQMQDVASNNGLLNTKPVAGNSSNYIMPGQPIVVDSARRVFNSRLQDNDAFFKLDTVRNINVVLMPQQGPPVQEVVVDRNMKKDRMQMRTAMPREVMDTLEPAEGWTSFDDYVANNLKMPEELKIKPVTGGEVELSFDVNDAGEPINIKVVKSLCTSCDAEAIRLLKQGPKWKKKKNKKGKITIRF
jgi:hypothetical protein